MCASATRHLPLFSTSSILYNTILRSRLSAKNSRNACMRKRSGFVLGLYMTMLGLPLCLFWAMSVLSHSFQLYPRAGIQHCIRYHGIRTAPSCWSAVSPKLQSAEQPCACWRRKTVFSVCQRKGSLCCCTTATASNGVAASVKRVGVVIVDHGSRREQSNRQLEDFVQLYRSSHSDHLAVAAHMEIARPSIAEAIATCAEAGCERVVVAPYFLSQGRHIQQDIPALVAEAQADHPQLECVIADPIGLDEGVVKIIRGRVVSAIEQVAVG